MNNLPRVITTIRLGIEPVTIWSRVQYPIYHYTTKPPLNPTVVSSDVKRGQKLEVEIEAEARALSPRPRPRPVLWGQGRGRGQFLEVEAKPRPETKLRIKKQQMLMTKCSWISRPIIMIKTTRLISYSLSHSNYLLWSDRLQVCSRRTSSSCLLILGCWFFCCRPRPSRGQMFKARPRPKLWGRGQIFGLEAIFEDLTSLVVSVFVEVRYSNVMWLSRVWCVTSLSTGTECRVADRQPIKSWHPWLTNTHLLADDVSCHHVLATVVSPRLKNSSLCLPLTSITQPYTSDRRWGKLYNKNLDLYRVGQKK